MQQTWWIIVSSFYHFSMGRKRGVVAMERDSLSWWTQLTEASCLKSWTQLSDQEAYITSEHLVLAGWLHVGWLASVAHAF
jgi:hypothetical protein